MGVAETIDQVKDFTDKLTFKRIIDIQHLAEENNMWNTKSDTFGWNLDRDTSNINYHCDFCKEDNKCAMSSLIHCDYRKDGKCTQYESK